MNKHAIYHKPEYAYGFNRDLTTFVIRLRTDKNDDFKQINLIYGMKYDYQKIRTTKKLSLKHRDDLYNYYEVVLSLKDSRLAYIFELNIHENTYYYSEKGITSTYDFAVSYYDFFQLPYTNKIDLINIPDWSKTAVFYQIFVDRFNIGNKDKNLTYINLNWGDKPSPKSFAGGDLQGIIDKLDYLQDLGVNAIYLTPVWESVSNHKYDVIDYFNVDPMFGDNHTLKRLIDELHKRGMRIVLDAVFNHSSSFHPFFQDVIKHGKDSKYYDFYIIEDDYVSDDPLNYATFSKVKYMPKWNTSNKDVQDYLISIGLHYIKEYDIDGWRLDVADEVSHAFWQRFRREIKNAKPDALIIGESWHASEVWLRGNEFDGIMNYSFTKAMLDYYAYDEFDAEQLANRLNYILMRYEDNINQMMLNLIDSHDTHRFYTLVNENEDKVLSALALTMMFPGIPCIYYGSEVPLPGGYDPDCRRCMPWDQRFDSTTYFKTLQAIIKLREYPELHNYDYKIYGSDDLFFLERHGENKIVFISNESNKDVSINVNGDILVSNKYHDGHIYSHGFVIYKGK